MAFFGKKFIKVTEKWVPVVKSVSNYDVKRLAKDIEKETTVSQTDVMAVASWDNHCDALTAKGRNTIVFLPFLCLSCFRICLFFVGFVGFVFRILFPINYLVAYDSHCFCNCNISQCYPKVGPRVSTHCINQHTGNQQQFAQIANRFRPNINNEI